LLLHGLVEHLLLLHGWLHHLLLGHTSGAMELTSQAKLTSLFSSVLEIEPLGNTAWYVK